MKSSSRVYSSSAGRSATRPGFAGTASVVVFSRASAVPSAFVFGILCLTLFVGCAGRASAVPFSAGGRRVALVALNSWSADGKLAGPESTAWFRFDPAKAGLPESNGDTSKTDRCLEVIVQPELPKPAPTGSSSADSGDSPTAYEGGPVTVSLAFVMPADLDARKALVKEPAPRATASVGGLTGPISISMVIPEKACGFAVAVKGSDGMKARIVSAAIHGAETGWQLTKDGFRAAFSSAGGSITVRDAQSMPIELPKDSLISISFSAKGSAGSIEAQKRVNFSSGTHEFGFRKGPRPATVTVPSFLAAEGSGTLRVTSGGGDLSGVIVSWNRAIPSVTPDDPNVPVTADPHMVIEWPQLAWRRSDREVFSWDRFPTVLIFDTASYAVQDRYFKRLAFFVEKKGWRGKLWKDADIEGQHAYYAHDYRADSLAEFFTRAAAENFPLNDEERELRAILLAEGIIRKGGSGYAAGAGAIISISRESESYLRYLFMAHEGYHGIYFTDPDFRAKVDEVAGAMDKRAIDYLQSYFTIVASLGYDTSDPYLMRNELMAYLMQQPLDRVGPYFAENISDRFLRHNGDKKLADWVMATKGEEFAAAAQKLNDYAFSRWGLAGGRVGLFWSDR
jgi:hypothetical protein